MEGEISQEVELKLGTIGELRTFLTEYVDIA